MDFLTASTWGEALAHKAERPHAVAISGGTDLMVDLNFDRRRPEALLDLNGVAELREWVAVDGAVRIGAAVPFTRIIDEIGVLVPALAIASRTVGSPQIRNRGTLGGNLATASPAGDALPPLVVGDAVVEVASVRGAREVPVRAFFTGPKRSVLAPDELIRAVTVPTAAGPQQFAKVGPRNAMVISVCSFALALDPGRRRVAGCIGSAGPTVLPTPEAESFLADELDWDAELDDALVDRFGELAGAAARPIDDVRGSAAYRRHAVGVLARRTLRWTWEEFRCG
ncbi:MAG TPA: FAD binding domain-containing protein [Jatrophihabitans sp.]|jgi:CO/xanthine dehydrogenase FAD-binding subunit|uniref:FAD binding domain-containing protein n=1 Tax=Jatrophihabitans sp. TaxID=1932789 RepID=UPI002E0CFF12|nr:FAD binding domain-containing protein [Jatrophihabitans sp.]